MNMKPDNLEQRLQDLPIRSVPPAWRQGILGAVREAARNDDSVADAGPMPWWRVWLWPCPQAWAGIAAVWCAVIVLNLGSAEPERNLTAQQAIVPAPAQVQMALDEQRRLLAELDLFTSPKPASPPFVLRPRSGRRPEIFAV